MNKLLNVPRGEHHYVGYYSHPNYIFILQVVDEKRLLTMVKIYVIYTTSSDFYIYTREQLIICELTSPSTTQLLFSILDICVKTYSLYRVHVTIQVCVCIDPNHIML